MGVDTLDLRSWARGLQAMGKRSGSVRMLLESADEIDALRAEVERLLAHAIPRCSDCGHRLDTEECGCSAASGGPVQTVINWTRYDGTPETLPEEGLMAFYWREGHVPIPVRFAVASATFDHAMVGWHVDNPRHGWQLNVGDLYAAIPARPQAPEVTGCGA